ncbi:hypothetical protein [uncultured Kordia sp.]|uniref:hypothetical protein n=1 Tax=uncultured Kordia sp. TaxID=507699 RepID=UPI002625AB39|nr:hypothetical protein [uncultured Kordia sp.]
MKEEIFKLCNKLAQNGWRELILSVTKNQLDIEQNSADKLKEALLMPIDEINRDLEGFDDYRLDGNQGITPMSFSKSLLYHALASPDVIDSNITYYPSLEELDLIENFIYSNEIQKEGNKQSLASLKANYGSKLVVAVFAYQYRTWEESSHRAHAGMNYSRTGISRIGTSESIHDPKRRSFWVGDTDGAISALPCRYGAFLAIKDTGENIKTNFSIMDSNSDDSDMDFVVPVYKLFEGDECLSDIQDLKLEFETYHKNEKLRKAHDSQINYTIPIDSSYDQKAFPFIIDDITKPDFLYSKKDLKYSSNNFIGSILIEPTKGAISEPAIQNNKYVAFKVPEHDENLANRGNRYNSSFQIPAGQGRSAPEYVNIRQRVKNLNVVNPELDIENINNLRSDKFNELLNKGGYLAVDFIDRTGDGFVKIKEFEGLSSLAAYSLITAIDFFPLVNQRDIFRWNSVPGIIQNSQGNWQVNPDSDAHFLQGGTSPLSDGRRVRANINHSPFISDISVTNTSVISNKNSLQIKENLKSNDQLSISYLPDAASNVFAPGWDISVDINNGTAFYAAYGLGSPFPEDAKLCAALNSYWPAAAPDASRTFFLSDTFIEFRKKMTAIPLTDEELGIHPKVANIIGVSSFTGWDGEYGPFLESDSDDEYVNYADIARSDYTFNAWQGFMNMDLLKKITTSQLIGRMEALRKCILELLPPVNDLVHFNQLWLASFQEIDNWSTQNDRMNNRLNGSGFRFIFITPEGDTPLVDTTDIKRLRMKVDKKYECQLDKDTFVWQEITPINMVAFNDNDIPKINFISGMNL